MKFTSKPLAEHREVPLPDEGRFEHLVDFWQDRRNRVDAAGAGENACYVVCVSTEDAPVTDGQVAEILALVGAQGGAVVGHEIVRLEHPDPRTLLRSGACRALAERAAAVGAELLVIDAEVSPSQNRNLEDLTGLSITDREAIILNVFLKHARTKSARMQIEISQLEYLRPRIRGLGLEMDQQAGGLTKARGPGETASELLARRLDGRLAELRRALAKLERASAARRRRRDACRRLVLVGYTNAGKTSLMNAMTNAGLSAADVPFETLDTTSRNLTRHGGDVLLSDTVGFIRRLPERLLASFESTLSEIHEASMLVIVTDGSDPEHPMHLRETEALLEKLGAAEIPRFYVFNKVDQVRRRPLERMLAKGHPFRVLSAFDEKAVAELTDALIRTVRGETKTKVFVPYDRADALSIVYGKCRIIDAREGERGIWFVVDADPVTIRRLEAAMEDRR